MQERAYSNRFDRKRSFSHPSSASACVSSSSLSSLSASESVYAYAWMENRPRSVEELRLAQRIGKIPKHGHVSDPAEKRALRILENSIRYRMVKFVERRKVIRKILATQRRLQSMKTEGLPADCKGIEDSEKELQDFYCKLLYIRHYPMEHKYVSVLKIRPDEDKKTSRLRDKILSLARARAAQGGAEAFEKVLSAEQDRDRIESKGEDPGFMEMTSPDIFVIDTDADAGPAQIPPSRENVHTLDCVIDREENQEESRNMKDKCGHETVRTKPDGSLEDRIFVRDSASKNSGASCSVSERTVSDEMKFEQKRRKKDEGASSSVHLTPKIQESRLSAEENDDFFLTSSFDDQIDASIDPDSEIQASIAQAEALKKIRQRRLHRDFTSRSAPPKKVPRSFGSEKKEHHVSKSENISTRSFVSPLFTTDSVQSRRFGGKQTNQFQSVKPASVLKSSTAPRFHRTFDHSDDE